MCALIAASVTLSGAFVYYSSWVWYPDSILNDLLVEEKQDIVVMILYTSLDKNGRRNDVSVRICLVLSAEADSGQS